MMIVERTMNENMPITVELNNGKVYFTEKASEELEKKLHEINKSNQ